MVEGPKRALRDQVVKTMLFKIVITVVIMSIMFSMPSSVQNTTAHVSAQVIRRGINGSI